MTLKNKDIAEGMRVINGKDVWKVLDWNSKYTDCLLQKIDKNGNKMDLFVVAENYELYGDEKEPQIAWMNGDYCIEKRQIDAEQYFVDFYKDNKKFKESKKSLKERSEENEIIVSELLDTVEYFCGLFEEIGELKGNALKDLKNAIERLEVFNSIGSIYQWGVEVLNKCGVKYKGLKESKKSLKESKEFFVGDKTVKGFEVCMIEDGKKYYLSKLAKNVVDSDWSSDHTYAKHWKDKSRAEEVVDMFNFELKENKKSIKEEINRSTWGKWKVKYVHHVEYFFNGNIVNEKTIQSLFDSEGFDTDVATVENEIKKAVRSYKLENLDGTALHIAHNSVGNRIDLVFNVGGLIGDVESLSKAIDECVIRINGDIYEQGEDMWNFGFAIYLTCDIYPMDLALAESKKKSRKSLKESAKPINEKNVAKFVDELNEWCDDNIHFADPESAKYTREYGKLYDFEWGWDYSYGDKGLIKVWDNEGTLDWFEETRVKDFIVKLAKKYGWYAEPVTNDSDFTFDEL